MSERDVCERLEKHANGFVGYSATHHGFGGDLIDVALEAAAEIRALRAIRDIAQEQCRQWAALTDAMSRDFRDEPESIPGRNVGECAVALIRRLRAELAALSEGERIAIWVPNDELWHLRDRENVRAAMWRDDSGCAYTMSVRAVLLLPGEPPASEGEL